MHAPTRLVFPCEICQFRDKGRTQKQKERTKLGISAHLQQWRGLPHKNNPLPICVTISNWSFFIKGWAYERTPTNGVGTNFEVGVGEARPKGPRAGDGVLEGQPAPPHQIGDLRERCKLPQRGLGQSPGRRRVFLYSVPSDCLSPHLGTCCIQFAWLDIRFFLGGYLSIYLKSRDQGDVSAETQQGRLTMSIKSVII